MASYQEHSSNERFEKRKMLRFPVQLPVELGQEIDDLSSICTNLSSEGVSVETSHKLSVGERLSVKVVVSSELEPLRMLGQVVWRKDISATDPQANPISELGIRFLKPLPSPWKAPSDTDFSPDPWSEEEVEDALPPYRR